MEYQIMFYGGLAGALITLIISIIVFMKLKISQVLTDITGYGSRKKARGVTGKPRRTDTETKKTTSEIKLRKKDVPAAVEVEDTAIMSQELEPTAILQDDQKYMAPTELLVEKETAAYMEEETMLLSDEDETTLLQEDETTILTEGDGETALLNVTNEKSDFEIEVDVMIVHTNQVIEKRGAYSQ